jgi:hypothetical protein
LGGPALVKDVRLIHPLVQYNLQDVRATSTEGRGGTGESAAVRDEVVEKHILLARPVIKEPRKLLELS